MKCVVDCVVWYWCDCDVGLCEGVDVGYVWVFVCDLVMYVG